MPKQKTLLGDISVVIIIMMLLGVAVWTMVNQLKSSSSILSTTYIDTAYSIDDEYEMPDIADKYAALNDSLNKVESEARTLKYEIARQKTNLNDSGGFTVASFGVHSYTDSIFKNKATFIVLADFGLNMKPYYYGNNLDFFYKNGKSYLRTSKIIKRKNKYNKLVYTDSVVNYRYDLNKNSILIPIKNKLSIVILKGLCYSLGAVTIFIILFGLLLILKFLLSISKNKMFEEINIRRLFWVAICCFATTIIPYLVSLIIYLIYYRTLSHGVAYTKAFSGNEILLTLFGILFFGLYIAFKKGMKIKQENDLTI